NIMWNTFLGGNGGVGNAVAVDGSGNVYVSGYSTQTWGSPVQAFAGSSNAFAAKLDSNGNLIWNTFLGDTGFVTGHAVAVDGSGRLFLSGRWYNALGSNSTDAFVAKLDASGSQVWNTFLGG